MSETKTVKGYKVFKPDWTCGPGGNTKQYMCPGKFEENVEPIPRLRGMHFCVKAANCFNDHAFDPRNKVAEVIAYGDIRNDGDKYCTNKLEIVREVPWQEVLEIVNTGRGCTGLRNSGNYNSGDYNSGNRNSGNRNSGDYNSGNRNSGNYNSGNRNNGDYNSGNYNSGNYNSGDYNSENRNSGNRNSGNRNSGDYNSGNRNSGDYNTGDYNTGDYNSGNYNSGDCNSGNYNSGDCNSGNYNSGNYNSGDCNSGNYNSGDWNKTNFSNGCFNTIEPTIFLFNKPSEWTYREWCNSEACKLMREIEMGNLEWVGYEDMTAEEKAAHPKAKITGGYLKVLDNSESCLIWWRGLSDRQKNVILTIPNFDKAIFKKITGIDVDKD